MTQLRSCTTTRLGSLVVIDPSVIVAMIKGEPEVGDLLELCVATSLIRLSAAGFVEAAIVLDNRNPAAASGELDELLELLSVVVVPVTPIHARLARLAHRQFGRGSGHPARLNFGDCFSYALAKQTGEPLLFKGTDFSQTDITPAI